LSVLIQQNEFANTVGSNVGYNLSSPTATTT